MDNNNYTDPDYLHYRPSWEVSWKTTNNKNMEDKIQTAKKMVLSYGYTDSLTPNYVDEIADLMIEFAKMHVQIALKIANDEAEKALNNYLNLTGERNDINVAILNSYPKKNIK